jgi:hypothetical protein
LLRMHQAAFHEWGAVPEEILYDRMRTIWAGTDDVARLYGTRSPRLRALLGFHAAAVQVSLSIDRDSSWEIQSGARGSASISCGLALRFPAGHSGNRVFLRVAQHCKKQHDRQASRTR